MLIEPYTSVGNLLFTDTRQDVRIKMNEYFTSGINAIDVFKEYYDHFEHRGLVVCYDYKDNINAFQFFEGSLIFNNEDIFKKTYNDLVKMFLTLDASLEWDYNGFTSYKYGIGGNTNDDPEDINATTEAIIVFRRGYYDGLSGK